FSLVYYFFFFQAEDGIRDFHVTGVRRVLFRSGIPLRGGNTQRLRPGILPGRTPVCRFKLRRLRPPRGHVLVTRGETLRLPVGYGYARQPTAIQRLASGS